MRLIVVMPLSGWSLWKWTLYPALRSVQDIEQLRFPRLRIHIDKCRLPAWRQRRSGGALARHEGTVFLAPAREGLFLVWRQQRLQLLGHVGVQSLDFRLQVLPIAFPLHHRLGRLDQFATLAQRRLINRFELVKLGFGEIRPQGELEVSP